MTVTAQSARDWLAAYGDAWRQRSPQRAAQLFASDCRYHETPFAPPEVGRDGVAAYWQAVPDGQADVEFDFRVVAVAPPEVVAHWRAAFTRTATGARVRLDGMFLLEFDDAGLCRTLREWWHADETPRRG
mgnify:CR=1 FL=1